MALCLAPGWFNETALAVFPIFLLEARVAASCQV